MTITEIKRGVCKAFGVTMRELIGHKRGPLKVSDARFAATAALRTKARLTLRQISKELKAADNAICHRLNRHAELVTIDPDYKRRFESCAE